MDTVLSVGMISISEGCKLILLIPGVLTVRMS